jgi:hypothetical protein
MDVGDFDLIQSVIARMTYKPGYALKAGRRYEGTEWSYPYVSVVSDEQDSRTHEPKPAFERWVSVGQTPTTEASVVAAVRVLLKEIEIHEMNEWLRLDGEIVHDPHLCVDCVAASVTRNLIPAYVHAPEQSDSAEPGCCESPSTCDIQGGCSYGRHNFPDA